MFKATKLITALKSMNVEFAGLSKKNLSEDNDYYFYAIPWNSLSANSEKDNLLNDALFLSQVADYVNNLPPDRPVILIGHSFGGDSVLKVAPRINRRILFLGVLDPVAALAKRQPVTQYGVPENVNYFFNRWQTVAPWPIDLIDGTVQNCRAGVCSDQQEQSLARNADSSEIRRSCRFDEGCNGNIRKAVKGRGIFAKIKGIGDSVGDVVRDAKGGQAPYGTAAQRLMHQELPSDAYIQQQIIDRISSLLADRKKAISPLADRPGSNPQPQRSEIGNAYNLPGPAVATAGRPAKYVFPMGNKIVVVNDQGEVWAHDVGSSVGNAYNLPGPAVATAGRPAKYVFPMGNKIVVVNDQGEVWAHDVSN